MIQPWSIRKLLRGAKPRFRRPARACQNARPGLEILEGRLLLAVDTWTGGGTTTFWMNAANWGGTAPHAGDDLVFPDNATHLANMNDFAPGTVFHSLSFTGNAYSISGNPLGVSGGISTSNSTGTTFVNLDVTLTAPQTFDTINTGTVLNLSQPVHLGSNALTVSGLGTTIFSMPLDGTAGIVTSVSRLTLSANNTYSGNTIVNGGTVTVTGSQPSSSIQLNGGGALGGSGTVGAVTSTGGVITPGSGATTAVLRVHGNVTLDANSSFDVSLNGTVAGQSYDQVVASGTVNLGGSTLNAVLGFASVVGDTYTIVHSSGLSGTFQGLPDGTDFSFSGKRFQVHYTSTDVTLTQVTANTMIVLTTSANSAVFGQPITFTATVSPVAPDTGTPTGMVSFVVDGGTPTSATLSNGKATLASVSLSVGNHTIAVSYIGDVNFNGSGPMSIPQSVSKANSSTTQMAAPNPVGLDNPVTFTATVSAVAPGVGSPTGSVTFAIDGTPQPTVTLVNGQAQFTTSTLTAGNHTITTTYGGDGNFNMSVSGNLTVTVRAVPTSIAIVPSLNPAIFGQTITLTATVSVVGSAVGSPTGNVVFNNGNSLLGTAPLQGNTASIMVSSLSQGTFDLTARYSGDNEFGASTSNTLVQTVNAAPTSTQLMASINSILRGASVTFTAQVNVVAPGVGVPTGSVVFMDNGTTIGSAGVNNGTVSFTTSNFLFGKNNITAVYSGVRDFATSTSAPTVVDVGTPDQRFVAQIYVDLLNRPVDAAGFNTWMLQLSHGVTHAQVAAAILGSQEYETDVIENLYHQYLRRDADPGGLATFLGLFAAGDTIEQMAALIISSPEYFADRGAGTNNGFVQALYMDALHRAADPGGLAFFDAQLASGMTTAQVAGEILASTEYREDLIQANYLHFLHRQPDPVGMNIFLNALNGGATDQAVIDAIVGSAEYASLA